MAVKGLTDPASEMVAIRLAVTDHATELTIRDDGIGLDRSVPARPITMGIASMCERIHALGGAFAIASAPSDGTTVRIAVPLSAARMPSVEPPHSRDDGQR